MGTVFLEDALGRSFWATLGARILGRGFRTMLWEALQGRGAGAASGALGATLGKYFGKMLWEGALKKHFGMVLGGRFCGKFSGEGFLGRRFGMERFGWEIQEDALGKGSGKAFWEDFMRRFFRKMLWDEEIWVRDSGRFFGMGRFG